MNGRSKRRSQGSERGTEQIGDPVEFIRREHDRHYEICDQLQDLPNALDAGLDLDWAKSICDFLSNELPRHVKDEEEDLFPTLAIRCKGHEGLDLMLSQLKSEHQLDLDLVEPIMSELRAIMESGAPRHPSRFLVNLRAFAETQRRHLLWENAVVLPLAERHLTADDRNGLSAKLMARREPVGSS